MAKESLRNLGVLAREGERFQIVPRFPETHCIDEPSFFVDDGFNLETLEQESAFMDLISRIRSFEVDMIWVYDVNRVFRARSNAVLGTIMDIIENHDVKIMSPMYWVLEAGPALQILGMMGVPKNGLFQRSRISTDLRTPRKSEYGFPLERLTKENETTEVESPESTLTTMPISP